MSRLSITEQKPEQTPSAISGNLLGNIEKIIEQSENSELSKEFFEKTQPYINLVKNVLHLSDVATVFFALFVDNHDAGYTYIDNLSKHLNCRKTRILQYVDNLNELEKRGLIRCKRQTNTVCYRVPIEVILALSKGKNIEPRQFANISQEEFFETLNDLFEEKREDELLYSDLENELITLMNANQHLEIARAITRNDFENTNSIMLLYFCHKLVNEDDDMIGFHDFEYIFEKKSLHSIKRTFREGYNELIEGKWIENLKGDGFLDANYYHLTDKAKHELIGDDLLTKGAIKLDRRFIVHSAIKRKELFFDALEQEQIDKLTDLLKPENFAVVQKRLLENGMRDGFACLFYGAPGTGKTETVFQIARQTGRNILPVNVSEIKSLWVGETEKNIKKLFDDYRENVAHSEIAPILLFNEADAVLGTRLETLRSVDKMENSLQNIILQEMENLNGIMIATTNLTINLDKAFERRFIYKIEFQKPSLHAKKQIWRAMLKDLSDADAEALAQQYDFSGGQIENIVRKSAVEQVLTGGCPSLETVHGFCKTERLHQNDCRPRIGFN